MTNRRLATRGHSIRRVLVVVAVVVVASVRVWPLAAADGVVARSLGSSVASAAIVRYLERTGFAGVFAELSAGRGAEHAQPDRGVLALFDAAEVAGALLRVPAGWSAWESEAALLAMMRSPDRDAVAARIVERFDLVTGWSLRSQVAVVVIERDENADASRRLVAAVLARALADLESGREDAASVPAVIAAAGGAERYPALVAAEQLREIARLTRFRSVAVTARTASRSILDALRGASREEPGQP